MRIWVVVGLFQLAATTANHIGGEGILGSTDELLPESHHEISSPGILSQEGSSPGILSQEGSSRGSSSQGLLSQDVSFQGMSQDMSQDISQGMSQGMSQGILSHSYADHTYQLYSREDQLGYLSESPPDYSSKSPPGAQQDTQFPQTYVETDGNSHVSGPSGLNQAVSVFSASAANTSVTIATGARALQALSRDPQDEGQTFLIKGLEDFRRRSVADLLRNKDNSFRISKTDRVIYFDHDDDTWYLHRFLRRNRTASHPGDTLVRVPVTSCVDMSQSAGGHVSPNVDVTVSVGHAAAAKAGVTNLVAMAAGVSLAHAVSFSGAVTCHVAAGHYGQMFLRPFYYEVPRGRRVGLQYYRKVGLVEKGEWEETEAFRQLVVRAPTVECAVGRTRAVCAA